VNLFAMMETSGGAMQAERMRAEVVAANMANAETTRTSTGGPYHRQHVVFAANAGDPDFSSSLTAASGSLGFSSPATGTLSAVNSTGSSAVAPGVQILRRRRQRDLETRQPAARHRERRFVDAPHRAVGAQSEISAQLLGVINHQRFKMRAADLFFEYTDRVLKEGYGALLVEAAVLQGQPLEPLAHFVAQRLFEYRAAQR